ncbi:hypothetical protein JCM11641_005655 [Rhodosporidiobolus odoratus]
MLGHLPSAPHLEGTPLQDFQERARLFTKYEALSAATFHNHKEMWTNRDNLRKTMKKLEEYEQKVFVEYLRTLSKSNGMRALHHAKEELDRHRDAIKSESKVATKQVQEDVTIPGATALCDLLH